MNPNDILAQQQALLNQFLHNSQQVLWGALAIQLAAFIIAALVIYMFYARLRDIADELRKFRIAYEFAHSPTKSREMSNLQSPPTAENSRYQPKR